jgi:hypothetical protein
MPEQSSDQRTDTAEVGATGPADGMNRLDPAGSYVRIRVATRDFEMFHRISRGAAEVLIAELQGVLSACPAGCPAGKCHSIGECVAP